MPVMAKLAIVIGLLLVILGFVTYFGVAAGWFGDMHPSPTALIPSIVGILLLLCGALALNPAFLKHAMHAAAASALLGVLACLGRIVPTAVKGTFSATSVSGLSLLLMFFLCLAFVLLAVKSFINVRRQREASK
jgi:hypothetical protein